MQNRLADYALFDGITRRPQYSDRHCQGREEREGRGAFAFTRVRGAGLPLKAIFFLCRRVVRIGGDACACCVCVMCVRARERVRACARAAFGREKGR